MKNRDGFVVMLVTLLAPTGLAAADLRTITSSPGRTVYAYDHATLRDRIVDGRRQREALVLTDNSRDWPPDANRQWRSENLLVLHCDAHEYRIDWVRRYHRNGTLFDDPPQNPGSRFFRAAPGSFEMTLVQAVCEAS